MTHTYAVNTLIKAIIESPGDRHELDFSKATAEPTLAQVSSCCRCLPLLPETHYTINVVRICQVAGGRYLRENVNTILTGDYTTGPAK